MEIHLKTINGWKPPSPVDCKPTRITQVDSETDSVGNLKIKKILSRKMKFQVEWQFIAESTARRIMQEFDNFDALVIYEDLLTGKEYSGRFYPSDYCPVLSVVYVNGERLYKSFPLSIIEK